MAIYDREYYRREGPSVLGSLASTGQVCKWLIGINVVVYVLQCVTAPHGSYDDLGFFTRALSMDPEKAFREFQIWRVLTAAFLHDPNSIFHLFWNMLFLWWFGTEMEELYGKREFLAFYLVSAIAGNALWGVWTMFRDRIPFDETFAPQAMGASGAVTAVVVLFTLHYPTRRIMLFFLIPVPMWLLTVIFVGKDVHAMMRGLDAGGIAVAAHVGGAAFGLAYWYFQWRLAAVLPPYRGRLPWAVRSGRNRPRLRIYQEEVAAPVASAPAERVDEQLEAKVDLVLEKLGRVGAQNLTPEEQAILKRASEVYRKRRT